MRSPRKRWLDDAAHSADAMLESQRRLVFLRPAPRPLPPVLSLPAAGDAASRATDDAATTMRPASKKVATPPTGIDPTLAATYIASAATGLIVAWVLGQVDADEETIAVRLNLMPVWMHTAPTAHPENGIRHSANEHQRN